MSEKHGLDKEGLQLIKQFGLGALSLLTHVNYELNMQRKQLMKPDIGKDYAALCSPHVPFTDLLFGDDLQKQLKDIGDVNKIGAKVQNHRGPQRNPSGLQQQQYKQTHFFSAESKKLQRPNFQTLASQGVSKDEPRQEAITVAHALNMVNCGVQKFVAGNIAHHCSDWRSITSDPSILEIVLGYRIDFERLPYQASVLCIKCSKGDEHIIAVEVQKLLDNIDKGVLNKTAAF